VKRGTERDRPATGLVGPTAGFAVVGLSAFVLLASGPRLLGDAGYSVLAISWTIVTIIGIGLALPGEQTITRHVARGSDPREHLRVQVRLLVVAAALAGLVAASAVGHNPLMENSILWSVAVVAAAGCWALNVGPRGLLGGRARFAGYGRCLSSEGLARILCCALAWLWPALAAPFLAAALVLPLLTSCLVGWWEVRRDDERTAPGPSQGHWSEQATFTAVALSIQLVLNTAPLFIQWHSGTPTAAGEYVSATTYMRIPMLLTSGFITVALSRAATASAQGDAAGLRGVTRHFVGVGSLAASVLTLGALLVSGPALTVYYGRSLDIGVTVLAAIGVTTVMTVAANILTQVVLACHRHRAASVAWAGAAAVTLTLLAAAAPDALPATLAIMAGLLVSLVATAVLVSGLVRRLSGAPVDAR
jgi:O-antigen/teichoic acid export membrane protein